MVEPNKLLRSARERTESPRSPGQPMSRAELAEQVNAWIYDNTERRRVVVLDANYVGKLERGLVKWPQDDYRAALRAVLGARTDTDLGFRRPTRSLATVANVDRKDFLRAALGVTVGAAARPLVDLLKTHEPVPVPSFVGPTEIQGIRQTALVFGTWDHTYGGGLVREAVAAQLRYSAQLLNARCAERHRNDLYSAVGYLGHTAGFMAFDAYAHDDARSMFQFALACAEEATDWHLRAKILSSMARQAIWCGDPDDGLTLVELAMVRADRLTPTERAMLLSARARALAKLRRTQETLTTIGMADEEFSHAEPANDPDWMRYYDTAQHRGDTGHALWDIAMTGKFVSEATERLAQAVAGHTDAYARSRAISGIKLASLTMAAGDPDEAGAIGQRALTSAGKIRSRRAADDLRQLRSLAAPHDRIDEVAALCHAIGERVANA
ncbi:XRE family transcriptional regulator [Actinophytocola glycyrrhizae]|uniref:XRE family transcriptional regulator n=1 Tax=Actinophytocola glycyrrhizae TaxID=2044873 RepID=A0ABV9SCS7_9PSEU